MSTPRTGLGTGRGVEWLEKVNEQSSSSRASFELQPHERSLTVCLWWRLRREGVHLPAEPGVILLSGGKS
jgi:hypothetical protein